MGSGLGLGLRRLRAPGLELLDPNRTLTLTLGASAPGLELLDPNRTPTLTLTLTLGASAPGLELLDEHVELILDLRRGARRAELLTKLGERLLLQHGQLLAVPAQGEG